MAINKYSLKMSYEKCSLDRYFHLNVTAEIQLQKLLKISLAFNKINFQNSTCILYEKWRNLSIGDNFFPTDFQMSGGREVPVFLFCQFLCFALFE